jgi:hypothetical protein
MDNASNVRFPNIKVQLVGMDGNAFFILGRVSEALRKGGASREELTEFQQEATSGDYDKLLQTVMRWVNATGYDVDEDEDEDEDFDDFFNEDDEDDCDDN